jgi:hypothetical protein
MVLEAGRFMLGEGAIPRIHGLPLQVRKVSPSLQPVAARAMFTGHTFVITTISIRCNLLRQKRPMNGRE